MRAHNLLLKIALVLLFKMEWTRMTHTHLGCVRPCVAIILQALTCTGRSCVAVEALHCSPVKTSASLPSATMSCTAWRQIIWTTPLLL